jgi:hypothetical protein
MTPLQYLCVVRGRSAALALTRKVPLTWGGGDGTRTRNPLLAKQVRCQLRHAPQTRPGRPQGTGSWRRPANQLARPGWPDLLDRVGDLGPEFLLGLVGLHLAPHGEPGGSSSGSSDDLLHDDSLIDSGDATDRTNCDLGTVPNGDQSTPCGSCLMVEGSSSPPLPVSFGADVTERSPNVHSMASVHGKERPCSNSSDTATTRGR